MGVPSETVTLLFTDVEGSVRLWEADREAMAEASARYGHIVREHIEVTGGQVVTAAGEALRAVFADPAAGDRQRWSDPGIGGNPRAAG